MGLHSLSLFSSRAQREEEQCSTHRCTSQHTVHTLPLRLSACVQRYTETRARASRDFAIHFLAQRHFCNETQKTVRLDRNTLDLSLLPGVHKAAVALRCMHVPDLSYSKGEAKRSTSEELIHDGDDDELKWRPKTRKIVRGRKQPGKICNKTDFYT